MLPTKSDMIQVAELVQHQWSDLAGAMKPRPFYRNELMKFENETDNSDFGKAFRMLQEWRHEHRDQATVANLRRSLAASKLTHVIKKLDHASSLQTGEYCDVDMKLLLIKWNNAWWELCVTIVLYICQSIVKVVVSVSRD